MTTHLEESEEDHRLVEDLLDLLVAQPLHTLLQLVVDKEREELGAALVQVEEVFEVPRDDLEEGVAKIFTSRQDTAPN